jgi:hypothetical protein
VISDLWRNLFFCHSDVFEAFEVSDAFFPEIIYIPIKTIVSIYFRYWLTVLLQHYFPEEI